jgi:hypothetical protein
MTVVRTPVTWWHAPRDANCQLSARMLLVGRLPNARLIQFGEDEAHLAVYHREGEILDELLARGDFPGPSATCRFRSGLWPAGRGGEAARYSGFPGSPVVTSAPSSVSEVEGQARDLPTQDHHSRAFPGGWVQMTPSTSGNLGVVDEACAHPVRVRCATPPPPWRPTSA